MASEARETATEGPDTAPFDTLRKDQLQATLRSGSGREAAAAAVAVAGEALVVLLAFSADVDLAAVLMLHAGVAGLCAALLLARREPGTDLTLAVIILLLVAVAGPAGAVAALAALPFAGNAATDRDVLDAWYDRLASAGRPSAVALMCDRILSGRVQRLDHATPANYLETIASGSLDQRQRALGLIAREFHPDYAPVLDAALRSPEPVVRVQAAAVVARVRDDLKKRIERLATPRTGLSLTEALALAGDLGALKTCPLVEPAHQARCHAAQKELLEKVFAGGRDMRVAASRADPPARAAIETFLIAGQRFSDLRVLRRVAGVVSGSRRRIRRRGEVRA
ncbi:MAG: hypothetical protein ABL907_08780 [Hyphomicrobium sp.]